MEQIFPTPDENYNAELVGVRTAASETDKESSDYFDEAEGQLAVDVYQTADDFIIEAPIAGIQPENIDIAITNESVTIKGQRRKEKKVKDEDYLYQECFWGRFTRAVILPQEVDVEKSVAAMKDGILTISLPKLQRSRARKIKIKTD